MIIRHIVAGKCYFRSLPIIFRIPVVVVGKIHFIIFLITPHNTDFVTAKDLNTADVITVGCSRLNRQLEWRAPCGIIRCAVVNHYLAADHVSYPQNTERIFFQHQCLGFSIVDNYRKSIVQRISICNRIKAVPKKAPFL